MLMLLNIIFLVFYLLIIYFSVVSTNTDPDLYVIVFPDVYGRLFFHFKPCLGAAVRSQQAKRVHGNEFGRHNIAQSLHETLGLNSETIFNAFSSMLRFPPPPPSKFACETTAFTDGLTLQVPQESQFLEGNTYSKK